MQVFKPGKLLYTLETPFLSVSVEKEGFESDRRKRCGFVFKIVHLDSIGSRNRR